MSHIAFLTMDSLDGFVSYDHLAVPPLQEFQHEVDFVSWRKKIDWDQFDMVIIRTTWDYQNDLEQFIKTLQDIDDSDASLENSLDLVKWNIEKNYLRDLEKGALPIVPTVWETQPLHARNLKGYFNHFDTHHIIIKPTVSANADHTYWLKKETVDKHVDKLEQVFEKRPFMVQPFMESIVTEGEFSLFYFNGKYSHTILKTPMQHDFRVQEEHGGIIQSVQPDDEILKQGEKVMKSLPELPLYVRIDFVRDQNEDYLIMEIELIEPSLYFSYDDRSSQRFAKAVNKRLIN
ncbi:MAG TPA: hypothetical protein VKA34_23290 [Balneolales bacterium]|nr:hypothetical protein [Balneolales bacterium]